MPSFVTQSQNRRSPAETFAYITTLANWSSFPGHGPLPAIIRATADEPLRLGTRVRVENSDGSVHHEIVITFEPDRRYSTRMELVPPASYLMKYIHEDVVLTATAAGTQVTRRFETVPRSWLTAPLVALITFVFLRPAVRKHDHAVAAALA
jgi:hypothetical protein